MSINQESQMQLCVLSRMPVVTLYFIPRPRHNSCRKGVRGYVQSPHGCLDVSHRSWYKRKNPHPCRNCTFPKSVYHQNLESAWPVASCYPDPDDAPCWEMCDFCLGMGSSYSTPIYNVLPYLVPIFKTCGKYLDQHESLYLT